MSRGRFARSLVAAIIWVWPGSDATAQWSSNPLSNLSLADRSGEQVQPKIRATSDGGCYVSWFDNSAGGYDVYLQRLNSAGVEQWAHNGILIADRGVSSTVDYGLTVDASDNAILAFGDDRFGAGRITAQKIDPSGALQWNGTTGANAGAGSTTGSPPQVAALTDGSYVVIWNGTTAPTGTMIQRLDSSGALLGSTIMQNDTLSPQRPLQASDVQRADNGGFIVLFVRCTGSNCVTSNKQLYIQKYDSSGAGQWNGGAPMALMGSTGTIQTGTFPKFPPDGNGGAVLGWYENTTGARNAYIQHVLPDGTLKFSSPVSNVGPTNPTARIRVGAGLAYNPASGEYFLASPETDNGTQSQNSLLVQQFDSTGVRRWGDGGVTLLPITNMTQPSFVQSQIMGDGVAVFWMHTTSATTRVIGGARMRADRSVQWNELLACNGAQDKSRLDSAASTAGFAMVAYGNGATGSVDIQAQNVWPSGMLGGSMLGDMNCDMTIDAGDVGPFAAALIDPAGYAVSHACCNIVHADLNQNGQSEGDDIVGFIGLLP